MAFLRTHSKGNKIILTREGPYKAQEEEEKKKREIYKNQGEKKLDNVP